MKILIITDYYYRGGLETFINNLINSWDQNDEFCILCNKENPSISFFKKKINKHKLLDILNFDILIPKKLLEFFNKKKKIIKLFNYLFFFPFLIFQFKIFFVKNNFEKLIVINGGYPGSIYCRSSIISWGIFNKKKSIFNIHNMARKINIKNFLFEYFIDFLVSIYSYKIITVSNACAETIKNRILIKKFSKIQVVYNGLIDFPQNYEISKNEDKNYLLMLATFEQRKGYDYLFTALKHLKKTNSKFITKIYGYGNTEQYNNIQKKIFKYDLQDNINLNNFEENSFSIIKNCKLMLVPSQQEESFGYTIIEAMSLSKPIISTNIGGIPEVLDNGYSGYVCSKNNPIEFAESIKELLNNDDKYKNFSINARNRYLKNFGAKKMSEKYRELLI